MTPLPPSPFLRGSVASPPAAVTLAAGSCTGSVTDFYSVPHATPACAMGASRDCNDAVSGATAGETAPFCTPPGYVLVPIDELKCWRDDLEYYREKERNAAPAMISAPSHNYLLACDRDLNSAILRSFKK